MMKDLNLLCCIAVAHEHRFLKVRERDDAIRALNHLLKKLRPFADRMNVSPEARQTPFENCGAKHGHPAQKRSREFPGPAGRKTMRVAQALQTVEIVRRSVA